MVGDLHWAARYQFLEALWEGQDRLILDPAIESVVAQGGPPLAAGEVQPLSDLFDELVPREAQEAHTWVVVSAARRAAEYSLHRPGAAFVGIDEALELAAEEPWQVALVDLGAGVTLAADRDDAQRLDAELAGNFSALLELLAEGAEEGKTVALWLSLNGAAGVIDRDAALAWLDDFVAEHLPGARIFGAGAVPIAGFYDFGPADDAAAAEGVDIDFDNRIGAEEPATSLLLVVAGAALESDGLTLIELPGDDAEPPAVEAAGSAAGAGAGADAPLRRQLAEARRAADESAIERQRLIERLDAAEDRCAELEERLAGADPEAIPSSDGPRLDAALAREQALRWEVHRLGAQVDALRARPVEELEAEVAVLELRLRESAGRGAPPSDAEPTASPSTAERRRGGGAAADLAAGAVAVAAIRGRLDRVLRRLERGGMAAVELHRELAEIRRRVR